MGEFWGEHADKSISGWSSLIAFFVSGDILGANRDGGVLVKKDNLYMVGFFAELIVVGSGRGEGGFGIVGDDAD